MVIAIMIAIPMRVKFHEIFISTGYKRNQNMLRFGGILTARLLNETPLIKHIPIASNPPMIGSRIIERNAANLETIPARIRRTPAICMVIRIVTFKINAGQGFLDLVMLFCHF